MTVLASTGLITSPKPTVPRPGLLQWASFVRLGIGIDRAPAWLWLALLALALWPTGVWMSQRLRDGSDDPLGVLALAALGGLVGRHRQHLRAAPRLGWLALALAGAVTATAARAHLPALASALLALLALAAGLMAFLPERVASAPVLGLSVLSLPLLASLQFYAGYPLRVLTAEASRWLLALQHEVVRSGASLVVNGQLVMVDAPCSGVQMVWLGYFTACTVGLYAGHGSRRFLARLPAVGALVLLGNVLRNTVLVAAQAAGTPLTGWAHEGVGLLVLAGVCAGIAWVMGRTASGVPAQAARRPRITNRPGLPLFDNRFVNRVLHKSLWAVLLPLCALGGVAQALAPLPPQTTTPASTELPAQWNGAPLRPLALTEVEQRFARQFPGTVARLTDGQQVLVWRTVRQPTRMLHPASDCYRGLGWRIHGEQLEAVAGQARWRCFIAERGGRQLRVCEQIEDAQGQTFTDASAWYWAALAGQSSGPWRAVTVARAL